MFKEASAVLSESAHMSLSPDHAEASTVGNLGGGFSLDRMFDSRRSNSIHSLHVDPDRSNSFSLRVDEPPGQGLSLDALFDGMRSLRSSWTGSTPPARPSAPLVDARQNLLELLCARPPLVEARGPGESLASR